MEAEGLSSAGAVARATLDAVTRPGERLLLALSGGSDSVALLGLLAPWARERLVLAHVHHGLRAAADHDALHVRALAEQLNLPLRLVRAAPSAQDPGLSETAARSRRLPALAGVARDAGCAWVLTAHHADDAQETLALNLLRGHRGLRALAGIPTCRPLAPGVGLLRPLLAGASPPGRGALERARRAAGLEAVFDETNLDRRIPRNAVRACLAEGRPPLTGPRLMALRRVAARRLQATLAAAAGLLERELVPLGSGSLLRRRGLGLLGADHGLGAEGLRLLGLCLARPRRLTLRATLVRRLSLAAGDHQGELLLPGDPVALSARLGPEGLHLPDEPLAPGTPAARLVQALAQTPLHL